MDRNILDSTLANRADSFVESCSRSTALAGLRIRWRRTIGTIMTALECHHVVLQESAGVEAVVARKFHELMSRLIHIRICCRGKHDLEPGVKVPSTRVAG